MTGDDGYPEEEKQPVILPDAEEQRRVPRVEKEGNILWSYASNPVFPEQEGELIDMNQLGLGFISHMPIREGSVVRVKAKGLWQDYRYATVMRCNKVDDESCVSGIIFNLSLDFV